MRAQNRWDWSTMSDGPEGHVHRSRSWSQDWFRSRRGDPLGSFSFPATWRGSRRHLVRHRPVSRPLSELISELDTGLGTRDRVSRLPLHFSIWGVSNRVDTPLPQQSSDRHSSFRPIHQRGVTYYKAGILP